ncbi:MAG TPA: hemerythrin domain-containing protein [Candidatus Limnocylindrales bacterium]|nr:hemerythrin domain-containing protein [Candidatus Limnocylindrales bacterium]
MPTLSPPETAAAIKAHHVELHDGLRDRVVALHSAARRDTPYEADRDAIVAFLDAEIVPHAMAEEQTLYRAADTGVSALLVEAMLAEHRDLVGRVDELRRAADPITAVAGASAILALFESHLAKENDRLIPALLAQPGVSLGELLEGMHELVG